MNTTLTSDQIVSYRQNGFIHQPGFLSKEETAELREAVLTTVANMGKKKVADGGLQLEEGDSYYDKVFTQRLNLWRIDDTIKKYVLNSELGKMLCELEGVEGYRVWHDQALIKEPYGNPTAWHLDNPYWSFYSRHAISIWISLGDATPENGCMYFVPGSQRFGAFESPGINQHLGDLFKMYPKMAEIDPVPAPMKAGDCSFHNGLAAHGAGANMTRMRRVAMTCAYMPIGSVFNGQQNILSDSYFKTLQKGDVLANDDWNPVVYVS